MTWILFEGSLLNIGEYSRFFLEGTILFGICQSGRKIPLKEYPDIQAARNALVDLYGRIENCEKKHDTQHGT